VVERDAGEQPAAALKKGFNGVVSKYALECDLTYDKRPSIEGEYKLILKVIMTIGGSIQLVYLNVNEDHSALALQDFTVNPSRIDYRIAPFVPGTHHVRIAVENGARTSLTVDGVILLDFDTPAFMQNGTPEIEVGVTGAIVPGSAITVHTDNVVFTAE
jgi:hypothetical protein